MTYVIAATLAAAGLTGCSDDRSSVMGPTSRPGRPAVTSAQVVIQGQPVQGMLAQGSDGTTLFRARIHAPGGLATIQRVTMRYSQPGPNRRGGPMMGGYRGTVFCYDDGTHGDDVPGDGIYQFMDPGDAIGCSRVGAPAGDYQYEFWCEDVYGQQSDVMSVTVTRR